jgi:hypothetical protein
MRRNVVSDDGVIDEGPYGGIVPPHIKDRIRDKEIENKDDEEFDPSLP